MAAPTPVTGPAVPAGVRLRNGYRTTIVKNDTLTAPLWPITVTPPGLLGPPAIDTSTMLNDVWETFAPGALIRLGEFSFSANYATGIYSTILTILNVEGAYTLFLPNGATLAFYAAMQSFVPDPLAKNILPVGTVTLFPTNTDPATGGEEPPVYTAPPSPPP